MKYADYVPIIAAVNLAVVAVLFLLGGWFLARSLRRVFFWKRTAGTVTELVGRGHGGGRRLLAPRVTFTAADGTPAEFVDFWASHPPKYSVGDAVTVLYDPLDRSRVCVLVPASLMFYPAWLFLLIGAVLLFFLLIIAGIGLLLARSLGPLGG